MTLLHKVYTFGWLTDHFYCYTWIAVIVLIAFDQTRLSYFVTFGNVCGAIVGEFLGEFIMEQRMNQITTDMTVDEIEWRRLNYGVFIWFITFIAFLIVGIVVNIILNKKTNQASA